MSGLRRFVTSPSAQTAATASEPIDLAALTAPKNKNKATNVEHCEMCSAEIPTEHGHIADLEGSSLMCACRACYLLFTHSEAGRSSSAGPGGRPPVTPRYRAIPDRYLTDPAHPVTANEWDALEIPVGLAFFLRDSRSGTVTAFYPSPAGATECRLDLQAWNRLVADHPLLGAAAPDVEAILIYRSESAVDSFVVPVDACYELAGRMRLHWRGFDGGSEAKTSIEDFLNYVRTKVRNLTHG